MKEQLHQLMQLAGVSNIYIVDDAIDNNGVNYPHFIKVLKKAQISGKLGEIDAKNEVFDFADHDEVLEDYSRPFFEEATPAEQLQYMRQACEVISLKDEEDIATNLGFANVLDQLRDEQNNIKLQSFNPREWAKKRISLAKKIPQGLKAIVLFDQKLDLAGGKYLRTRGIDLVKDLLKSNLKDCFITGILTYTVEDENLELIERAKLAVDGDLEPEQLFVLTKKRLEYPPLFVDGIKKLLLNGPSEKIKLAATKVGEAAFNVTKEKLLALDTYDFNQTVLQSSLKEGVWAPETLFRIIDIIYKDEIKRHILSHNLISDFNNLLTEASNLSAVEIALDSPPSTDRYALRRQELYAEGPLINGLFKPLENGDIFKVTAGTGLDGLYILLSQACDLVIRSGSNNIGRRGATVGHLLKIKNYKKADLELEIENSLAVTKKRAGKLQDFNHWKTKGVLEHIEEDPDVIGIVELPRAHVVNLDVLDLVMFNQTGVAEIDITAQAPTTLHAGLAKRFATLLRQYKTIYKEVNTCLNRLSAKKVEQPFINQLASLILPKISLNDKMGEPVLNGNTFSFGIERIKSLRDPYAKNLLDKYTRHLSRTGDLHDFAELEKAVQATPVSEPTPISDLALVSPISTLENGSNPPASH